MSTAVLPLIFAALAPGTTQNVDCSAIICANYSQISPQSLSECLGASTACVHTSAAVPPELYINELMADNDAAVAGPKRTYPDWVELYNAGNLPIDLSGVHMTDDLTDPKKWTFPDGTTMDSQDYLVIWADGYAGQGILHASFTLNANGETIALFADDGTTLIGSVTYGKQRDVSYGRLPDGVLSGIASRSQALARRTLRVRPAGTSSLSTGLLVITVIAIATLFRLFTKNNARGAQT